MDANRFDRIVQSFATVGTRRGVAQLLAAVPVIGIPATLRGEASEASRRRHVDGRSAADRDQVNDQRKNTRKKRKKKCTKIARTPKKGKPCCKGLVRDGAGRCARRCAATCAGCCAGQSCEAGTSNAACGAGGGPCGTCSGLLTCFNGACRCDVCPSGCQFASVQAAIDATIAGDTITICAGIYVENITISKNLTLIGAGDGADPAANTILRGTGSGRVVDISNLAAEVTLESLRVTGGSTTGSGGGINNLATLLTLTDCSITGNSAANGAGIISGSASTLSMSGCTVSANTVTTAGGNGGGIANNSGDVALTDCVVAGNTALGQGGGIFSGTSSATLTLVSSSVTGNHAGSDGGGILNIGTVDCSGDSTVSANTKGNPPVTSNCVNFGGGTGCNTCTL